MMSSSRLRHDVSYYYVLLLIMTFYIICGCNSFVIPASSDLDYSGGRRRNLLPKQLQLLTTAVSTSTYYILRLEPLKTKRTRTDNTDDVSNLETQEEKNTPWKNFWIGISDVYGNYWMHYSRQAALGYFAFHLIGSRAGQVVKEPLVQLFVFAGDNEVSYRWQVAMSEGICWVTRCVCRVTDCFFVKRKHSTWYAHSIVGAPIGEELLYRLFLLQGLKFVFQKLPPFKERKNIGPSQRHHLLSPWSLISSLWFAISHIDFGRELPGATKLVVETFAGSLFMITPIFERYGIFAAIGVHAAWNLAVHVPKVRNILLAVHFTERLLQPNPPLPLNSNNNSRFQTMCELWFEFHYIKSIL